MPVTSEKYQESEAITDELKLLIANLLRIMNISRTSTMAVATSYKKSMAELVLAGWRPSAEPSPGSKL